MLVAVRGFLMRPCRTAHTVEHSGAPWLVGRVAEADAHTRLPTAPAGDALLGGREDGVSAAPLSWTAPGVESHQTVAITSVV